MVVIACHLSFELAHSKIYKTTGPLPYIGPVPSGGFQILGPWAIFYMRGPTCERRESWGSGALSGGGGWGWGLEIFRF